MFQWFFEVYIVKKSSIICYIIVYIEVVNFILSKEYKISAYYKQL